MSKIKRLTANNFRGVIQESLDLDSCSVVILGENGTGKSSFIDALEFLAHGLSAQFKNLQILSWTLEDGPKLNIYKPRWILIEEKISSGDKDGAAASIRKELEAFLLEGAISLQARVPIKRDGRYTVGDLHDPLVSQFNKKIPAIFKEKEEQFINLRKNGIFGNLLTHNNPQAGNTSIDEIRGFADAVKQFEDVFVCPKCNTMIIYYPEAKIIRCRCKEKGILWTTKD